ncbi:hypothetical protein LZC95_20240 [Pendulispora brunnea]|uniref:Uncharacterized protein n=1 Tax=Pendulispora brunnea TaxID=2905690 RepID=A0ABZ2KM66_9BACT
MSIGSWERRVDARGVTYLHSAMDGQRVHRHCLVARASGLWVALDEFALRTRADLNVFRGLLVDAWYEAADLSWYEAMELAPPPVGTNEGDQETRRQLTIVPVGYGLVLHTQGTEFRTPVEMRQTVAELRRRGQACWPA